MTAYTPPPPPTDPVRITDQTTAVEMTARIIADARRFVWIRSLDLDPWLFDHPDVLDALRGFATHGHDTQVLILLHDHAAPQAAHAKLLDLAQRLPSVFEFREVDDPAYREDRSAMVAGDAGGYYFRAQGDVFEGSANLSSRARVRQLKERFDEIWERARVISEYRALGI
ncbi:hypothetical protein [Thermomonas sp.]|uniref:DUF7931 domain-containing protein n=1 Tax=Thermomonas sp. TaxID=1971895 RepID=UPI001D307056|nr:hypothetical protein [Thermomonas sp.]MBZ0086851.1 hypothetical protein [Thermomonas sp.]HRO64422.1 hypothetical protein [Thermomonas sp.]